MSGIIHLLFGKAAGASPVAPNISTLTYAPTSDNIDTIIPIGQLDVTDRVPVEIFGVSFNPSQQIGFRVFGRTSSSPTTVSVSRYSYSLNVENAVWQAQAIQTGYSNMRGLWVGGSDAGDNNYIGFLSSPNSRLGQLTNTGTNLLSNSLIVTANNTLDVENAALPTSTTLFVIQDNGVVTQYLTSGFNVVGASVVSTWASPYSVGNTKDGISFSSSGNKIYVQTQVGGLSIVYEHALGTPYTLSTVSPTPSRSATINGTTFQIREGYYGLSANSIDAVGFPSTVQQYVLGSRAIANPTFGGSSTNFISGSYLSPDNTLLFLTYRSTGAAGHSVSKISLSPALSISNATLSQQASIPGADGTATAVFFKPDGTRAFFLDSPSAEILAFDLSSPYDLSTLSSTSGLTLTPTISEANGLWFSTDGTALFVSENVGSSVYQFNLSTAWNVSTATQVARFFVTTQTTTPSGVSFSSSGTAMYVGTGTGRSVVQYTLAIPWSISSASFLSTKGIGNVCRDVRQLILSASESQALIISRTGNILGITPGASLSLFSFTP